MTDHPPLGDLDAVPEPTRWCCAGNAEDCPLCVEEGFDMLSYPWICPGHPDTPVNRARAQKAADGDVPVDWQEIATKARKTARLWQQWNARNVTRMHDAHAALARVEELAAQLEECAENALKQDDRQLYAALARDLRTRADTRTAEAAEPARCCVCGGGPVVYRNYREQPFCWPCADCQCTQNPCVRTGSNDPTVSQPTRPNL